MLKVLCARCVRLLELGPGFSVRLASHFKDRYSFLLWQGNENTKWLQERSKTLVKMGSLSWAGKCCSACVCVDVKYVAHWGIPPQRVVVQYPLVRWLFRKTMVNKHEHTDTLTCIHNNARNVLQNNSGFTGKLFSVLLHQKNSLKTFLGICYNISFERWVRKLNLGKGCNSYIPGMLSLSFFLFSSCSEWDLIHSSLSL